MLKPVSINLESVLRKTLFFLIFLEKNFGHGRTKTSKRGDFQKIFGKYLFAQAYILRVIECRSYKKMAPNLILTKLRYSKSDLKNINFSSSYGTSHFLP